MPRVTVPNPPCLFLRVAVRVVTGASSVGTLVVGGASVVGTLVEYVDSVVGTLVVLGAGS